MQLFGCEALDILLKKYYNYIKLNVHKTNLEPYFLAAIMECSPDLKEKDIRMKVSSLFDGNQKWHSTQSSHLNKIYIYVYCICRKKKDAIKKERKRAKNLESETEVLDTAADLAT